MNIIQQSETKLIIKEDTKALGLFILIIGFFVSWLIIFFVYSISRSNESFMQVAIGIASILFIFLLIYFYNVYKITVASFDKNTNKLIISIRTIFSKRQLEYSLKAITEIVSKPITIYNGAWGIDGILLNKLYGNQHVLEGVYYGVEIKLSDGKEYFLKPNAHSLYFNNPKNQLQNTAQIIANFLNVPFSQEELPKPILPFK